MMKVVFKDIDSDTTLGFTLYTDIIEILIPSFDQAAHDMFLMKRFVSKPNVDSWEIMTIITDEAFIVIVLKAIVQPFSVARYAKTQSKPAVFFLKKYNIVEVNFGFYSDTIDQSGYRQKNHSDTSALLPGELHKKRPCIILSARGNRVQVAPLSTKTPLQNNPNSVLLSTVSFNHMARRYREKSSVILLDMIQTVSVNRVFPPKAGDGKYHPLYSKYRLCSSDRSKLKQALAAQYNQEVNNEKDLLSNRFAKLSHEKGKLLEANKRMKKDLTQAQTTVDKYERLILKMGEFLEIEGSVETIFNEFR